MVLADQPHLPPYPLQLQRSQIDAVDAHRPLVGVVEALEEGDGGGLAAATASDEGHGLAGGDDEVEVVEDGVVGAGRVGESYRFESDLAADVVEDSAGVVVGIDEGDAVDTVEDRGRRCCGFCEVFDLRDGHSQRSACILPMNSVLHVVCTTFVPICQKNLNIDQLLLK